MTTAWLPQRKSESGSIPLLCLPFAGGGTAIYHQWRFDPRIDVLPICLPGREGRIREKPFEEMEELIDRLLVDLMDMWSSPFALFGHSMGARIAFELACQTTALGHAPVCVFVSACRAPGQPSHDAAIPLADLPDEEMVDALISKYCMQVPPDERALMLVLAATIRADLRLFNSRGNGTMRQLTCPVFACGGADDPIVARADLMGWQATTSGTFAVRLFSGGHFFLRTQHKPLGNFVQAKLLALATGNDS
jgi:medium-chain acyl-[acyl-carrier-protein] hydrolase